MNTESANTPLFVRVLVTGILNIFCGLWKCWHGLWYSALEPKDIGATMKCLLFPWCVLLPSRLRSTNWHDRQYKRDKHPQTIKHVFVGKVKLVELSLALIPAICHLLRMRLLSFELTNNKALTPPLAPPLIRFRWMPNTVNYGAVITLQKVS